MSVDTLNEHEQHGGHDGGHHEPPEVVDGRQRMAIWLFIGGDIITTSALLFTYLYLRGVNTAGHWMSMVGYPGPQLAGGHTYAYYENATLGNPALVKVGTLSSSLNWEESILALISGLVLWFGEKQLKKATSGKGFATYALLATVIVAVATAYSFKQMHSIPQIFVAVNDSQTMSYTAYDSCMMVIIGSAVLHFFILGFLGLGLAIRSTRGVINPTKWYQARLVRLFWVWVGISGIVVSAVTTTINTIH